MTAPHLYRWPALVGLLVLARRIGALLGRAFARETWGSPWLVLMALVAPFVFALYALRRLGHDAAGTTPDPASLVERFVSEPPSAVVAVGLCALAAWVVVTGFVFFVAVCGGGS